MLFYRKDGSINLTPQCYFGEDMVVLIGTPWSYFVEKTVIEVPVSTVDT